jgi:hypothetical protein
VNEGKFQFENGTHGNVDGGGYDGKFSNIES